MKQFSCGTSGNPDVETGADFYQYYRGGRRFFGLRTGAITIPHIVVERINTAATEFMCSALLEGRGAEGMGFDHIKEHGRFGTPLVGNHPFGESYVCLERTAVRESSKGLTLDANTRVSAPDPTGFALSNYMFSHGASRRSDGDAVPFHNFMGNMIPIDYRKLVTHIYNPEYTSVREALRKMLAGMALGVALNHFIGFHFIRKDAQIGLFLRDKRVGYVIDETPERPVIALDEPSRYSVLYYQHQFGNEARIET